MNSNDVYSKLKDVKEMLNGLQSFLLAYESQIEIKEGEIRVLDHKIAEKKAENQACESKASLVMAKASEEAAQIRKQAQDLLEVARTESLKARKEKEEAVSTIAEAKARSMKLESDEKAFNANVIIFERKRQALESAMRVG